MTLEGIRSGESLSTRNLGRSDSVEPTEEVKGGVASALALAFSGFGFRGVVAPEEGRRRGPPSLLRSFFFPPASRSDASSSTVLVRRPRRRTGRVRRSPAPGAAFVVLSPLKEGGGGR